MANEKIGTDSKTTILDSKPAAPKLMTGRDLVKARGQGGVGGAPRQGIKTVAQCIDKETGLATGEDFCWRIKGLGVVGLRWSVVRTIPNKPGYYELKASAADYSNVEEHVSNLDYHVPSTGRLLI